MLQVCPSDRKHWTEIFKWVENAEGEEEQVQEWVDKSHEWILYGDSQCFYRSDCEWDLCEALDPYARPSYTGEGEDKDIVMENTEPSLPPPYSPVSMPPPDPDIW